MKLSDLYHNLRERYWVPIATEAELKSRPLALEVFGEHVVLWRTNSGEVSLLEDRCPHRRAKLSQGFIKGERLSCRYHQWSTSVDGVFKPDCGIKSYPVEIKYGVVWAYFGSHDVSDQSIVYQPLLGHLDAMTYQFETAYVDTNFVDVMMNLTESQHLFSVHANSTGFGLKPRTHSQRYRELSQGGVMSFGVDSNLSKFFRSKSFRVEAQLNMPVSTVAVPIMANKGTNVTLGCIVPVNKHRTKIMLGAFRDYHFGFMDPLMGFFLTLMSKRILREDGETLSNLNPLCSEGFLNYNSCQKHDVLSDRALELLS